MIIRILFLVSLAILVSGSAKAQPPTETRSDFDGRRSYGYLREICSYGNRMSGSKGMLQQQELLEKHFKQLGVEVEYQRLTAKHPLTGKPVPLSNMIVHWHPESTERILLCAHYDTRPLPDQDPDPRKRREGVFLGANDGASGVAVLMELGHHMQTVPDRYGIDFVFFDAEEMVYNDRRDRFFLGSEHFAREYSKGDRDFEYIAGVLLDMVGDSKLSIFQERHSMTWPETRPIVKGIWGTAARLGVTEFIPRIGYEVRDDHLPLYQIAGIPVCNVIDFHYPDPSNSFWHTTNDTPGRCSAESLGKVGLVMLEWLRSAE